MGDTQKFNLTGMVGGKDIKFEKIREFYNKWSEKRLSKIQARVAKGIQKYGNMEN